MVIRELGLRLVLFSYTYLTTQQAVLAVNNAVVIIQLDAGRFFVLLSQNCFIA